LKASYKVNKSALWPHSPTSPPALFKRRNYPYWTAE
jgi:hypothetical protein